MSCAIFAIDQPYSYRIPQGMQILPGMRVVVPFGRANRRTEAIVLGGGVSNVGQYLVDGVTKAFRKHCFHASTNAKIMVAKLGNDAGIYGCCAMILGD